MVVVRVGRWEGRCLLTRRLVKFTGVRAGAATDGIFFNKNATLEATHAAADVN